MPEEELDLRHAQAKAHLEALDPGRKKWIFNLDRRIDLYGSLAELWPTLLAETVAGRDVYVVVNRTVGNKRNKNDVSEAVCLWRELDSDPKVNPKLQPAIVVSTSEGHRHEYFLHAPTDDWATWEQAQDGMIRQYESDPGAKGRNRLLRLAGTYNQKYHCDVTLEYANRPSTLPSLGELVTELDLELGDSKAGGAAETAGDHNELIRQIRAGEHLHSPIRSLMLSYMNKGLDDEPVRMLCESYIQQWPRGLSTDHESRYQKALEDFDAMLRRTRQKVNGEEPELVELSTPSADVPEINWPPGLIGELAQAAHSYFAYPNKIASIMTAYTLVAGIAGRKYNISNMGLNLYTTMMMPTGFGKDAMRSFCERVLSDPECTMGANALAFLGPQNFTGPKALLRRLSVSPSMLVVMTEAGLLYKTESGDKNGLLRLILQAFTSSGQYGFILPEEYSDGNNSTPMLRAPALTILNEATPITLISELEKRQSIQTGELPRMWVFMETGDKPYPNPNKYQLVFSPELKKAVHRLVQEGAKCQAAGVPEVIHMELPSTWAEYERWCVDQENFFRREDDNIHIMYSRAAVKVLKVAALGSIFEGSLAVLDPHWEWAKTLLEYELAGVREIIGKAQPMDAAVAKATTVILNLLAGEYASKSKKVSEALTAQQIFTESPFCQVTAKTPEINSVAVSPRYGRPKSGQRVTLDYMVSEGFLTEVKSAPGLRKNQRGYKVTTKFLSLLS